MARYKKGFQGHQICIIYYCFASYFLYYIYSDFPENANVNGVPWSEYCLISMIAFGIMGNAINLLGTKIADERKKNGILI